MIPDCLIREIASYEKGLSVIYYKRWRLMVKESLWDSLRLLSSKRVAKLKRLKEWKICKERSCEAFIQYLHGGDLQVIKFIHEHFNIYKNCIFKDMKLSNAILCRIVNLDNEILEWFMKRVDYVIININEIFPHLVRYGLLSVIKIIHNIRGITIDNIKCEDVDHEGNPFLITNSLFDCIIYGNLAVLEWILNNVDGVDELLLEAIDFAQAQGDYASIHILTNYFVRLDMKTNPSYKF